MNIIRQKIFSKKVTKMEQEAHKSYEERMLEAFVAKPEKVLWYKYSFMKYNLNGIDVLKWNWSWWAFFGGFLFLLYRKQYIPALILFIASITLGAIPFIGLVIMILSGGYSTYFIYKGYKAKRVEIESSVADEEKRIETMQAVGGYHQWVIWVYVAFITLSFTAGFFLAISPMMRY